MVNVMLKKLRIIAALFCFIAITLLFLDFTGTVHTYLGWITKIQLVPALFAAHFAIALSIIILTLILGRIYCSVICPLGIFQDIVSRLAALKKKARFSYKKPHIALIALRYAVFAVFALAIFVGIDNIVAVLEPYGAFGRMISQILAPVYKCGNNILAYFAERINSYAFYSVDIWLKSFGALILAILTFAIVGFFAYKSGRWYCNSICPVGALLGLLAKFSLIKPRIDLSKCKHCGVCAKNCKASCIDDSIGKVDYSRCIICFDCSAVCPSKAISYIPFSKAKPAQEMETLSDSGKSRRNILSGSALAVLGFAADLHAHRQGDGGLAVLENKKIPNRTTPIVPPGAVSIWNFHKHCTACQLCVSVCPNQVLSNKAFGFMKPNMSYERGYCRPECVKCSEVCPTGAIKPITKVEKSAIKIGCAVWKEDICIVNADKVVCDNCSRHCSTGAISMIPKSADDPASPKIPMIDTDRCIGCGTCEHLCPARPYSAIYVEGIETHREV
jgi:ferredoxin